MALQFNLDIEEEISQFYSSLCLIFKGLGSENPYQNVDMHVISFRGYIDMNVKDLSTYQIQHRLWKQTR